MLVKHVQLATNETRDVNQTTIKKCGKCGRMFFDKDRMEENVRREHQDDLHQDDLNQDDLHHKDLHEDVLQEEVVDVVPANDGNPTEEAGHQNQHSEEEYSLVWVKLVTLFWPAKIVRKMGELTEVELFDSEKTKKIVSNNKMKPFERLEVIPSKRNRFWKTAYKLALEELK